MATMESLLPLFAGSIGTFGTVFTLITGLLASRFALLRKKATLPSLSTDEDVHLLTN